MWRPSLTLCEQALDVCSKQWLHGYLIDGCIVDQTAISVVNSWVCCSINTNKLPHVVQISNAIGIDLKTNKDKFTKLTAAYLKGKHVSLNNIIIKTILTLEAVDPNMRVPTGNGHMNWMGLILILILMLNASTNTNTNTNPNMNTNYDINKLLNY